MIEVVKAAVFCKNSVTQSWEAADTGLSTVRILSDTAKLISQETPVEPQQRQTQDTIKFEIVGHDTTGGSVSISTQIFLEMQYRKSDIFGSWIDLSGKEWGLNFAEANSASRFYRAITHCLSKILAGTQPIRKSSPPKKALSKSIPKSPSRCEPWTGAPLLALSLGEEYQTCPLVVNRAIPSELYLFMFPPRGKDRLSCILNLRSTCKFAYKFYSQVLRVYSPDDILQQICGFYKKNWTDENPTNNLLCLFPDGRFLIIENNMTKKGTVSFQIREIHCRIQLEIVHIPRENFTDIEIDDGYCTPLMKDIVGYSIPHYLWVRISKGEFVEAGLPHTSQILHKILWMQ